jgi:hypothetical protein
MQWLCSRTSTNVNRDIPGQNRKNDELADMPLMKQKEDPGTVQLTHAAVTNNV